MKPLSKKFFFCLTLMVVFGYANAGKMVKREDAVNEAELTGYITGTINVIRGLPLIGETIAGFLEWCVEAISLFEVGTNGAIARLLGGALPCTISLEGTQCTGLTSNGGFGKLLMKTIEDIPSLVLPGFAKSIIKLVINLLLQPTADVLFGGVIIDPQAHKLQ